MEKYAIISSSEDGVSISFVDKAELLRRITPDKDGYNYYGVTSINTSLPDRISGDDYPYGLTILKCELVVPREKKTVTEFSVD